MIHFPYSSGNNRLEEALDCYKRAANMFKMAKNWSQAGQAFREAAGLHSKGGSPHDAATSFVDASNCYKKVDPNEAITCLLKAIEIYTDMGRFSIAAKHHQTIAEMYEGEANDLVSVFFLIRCFWTVKTKTIFFDFHLFIACVATFRSTLRKGSRLL